ncbi:MAG: hypothetical protein WA705_16120 [Candidatus Ozemobacteraceae bacterium]
MKRLPLFRAAIAGIFLFFELVQTFPSHAQVENPGKPYGERFRERASETLDAVKTIPENAGYDNRTCETCGRPTLFGTKKCFTCRTKEAPAAFKQAVDDAFESSRNALEALGDPRLTREVIDRLLQARRRLQDRAAKDSDYERAQRRQAFENLGRIPIASDGRTLNDAAKDAVRTYLPALEGSDYLQNPARTISYFLVLDGKGFIENVRCVRLSDGRYLTLMEAYQEFSGTDPQKAKDVLELMDDIRKISSPGEGSDDERLPALLDAVARGLRIIQRNP